MDKINLWLGVIVAALAIAGTVWGAFWAVLKLWIRPLETKIEHLEKLLTEKLEELEEQLDKMDERQRHHTGDTAKHVSEQWRIEQQRQWDHLEKRLDRMEQGILTLLSAK